MNKNIVRSSYMSEYNFKYLKTKKGFIQRLYTKMKSRITGSHGEKSVHYLGKGILDRGDFYKWMESNVDFHMMFSVWEASGYRRAFVPTIDRVDPSKGYTLDNIQIISLSENSRRAHIGRTNYRRALTDKQVSDIKTLLKSEKSSKIAKLFGVSPSTICDLKKGRTYRHLEED